MEREMELEYKQTESGVNFEYSPTQTTVQKAFVTTWEEKLRNDGKVLRVYVDLDSEKYFVDTFAAFAVGLISYEVACSLSDSNRKLYEITKEFLQQLKEIYKDRIEYQYLPQKKESYHDSSSDSYNGFDDNIYNGFNNKEQNNIGDFFGQFSDNNEMDDDYKDTNNKKM